MEITDARKKQRSRGAPGNSKKLRNSRNKTVDNGPRSNRSEDQTQCKFVSQITQSSIPVSDLEHTSTPDGDSIENFVTQNDLVDPLEVVIRLLNSVFPGTSVSTSLDSDQDGERDQWVRVGVRLNEDQEWVDLYNVFLERRMESLPDPRTDSLIRVAFE